MSEPGRRTVAAIDCGTNTIKLLIGSAVPGGPFEAVVREMRMVRLGQGVDGTGELAPAALARTFAAIDEYADLIAAHPVDRIRFVATSATRDARNSAVFVDGVRARLGTEPEVVSGAEEARLAFRGAVGNLRDAHPEPVLVFDVGGGSTELILGPSGRAGVGGTSSIRTSSVRTGEAPADVEPVAACSMDIGSVRLHERHLHSDPPTTAEIDACLADIRSQLEDPRLGARLDPTRAATVVGVAGTVTQLAAGMLDLPAYDRTAIDQAVFTPDQVHTLVRRLAAMSVAQRLALGWMHPGRADVIVAGGLIVSEVLRRTGVGRLVVSEADILDGIAWSALRE
ncbi:MAG: Ppx/GppA phosphatase family protein [Nocardioides sp.]|uniref:Ppx/GppA phosphatase family protein n=1 Tax=Nocardioides sp. TaxID=35761 RepID=UPI0039E44C59